MSQTVKMYIGTPPVLTTYENVTIDPTHELLVDQLQEEIDWNLNATDDGSNTEITTFVGPRPKK